MSSTPRITDDGPTRFLPQHGFGPDVNFDTIARYHPFLFRVHTPRSLSPVKDDSLYFVGAQFNAKFAPRTPVMSGMHVGSGVSLLETATYEDCTRHLDWETRSQSPFISTSFSFAWSLWDAVRRYNKGVKHDVEIAIIDARALIGQGVTAIQLLRKKPTSEQHKLHWRWYRFAQESQSVLVHGFIPRSAVITSIPLLSIIPSLPSYFLKPGAHPSSDVQGLDSLAWDFTDSKRNTYRKFCLDLQARFSRSPFHSRVRDLAVGSARLAIALLHPWFQEMVLNEEDASHFDLAIARTRELAGLIAHWPEQAGSRDYAEMYGVMKGLITLVGEEARSANTRRSRRLREMTTSEVQRLRNVVVDLEEVVRGQAIVIAQNAADLSRSASPSGRSDGVLTIEPRSPRSEVADQLRPIDLILATMQPPQPEKAPRSPSPSISPRDPTAALKLVIPQPRARSPSSGSSSSGSSPTSPLTPSSSPSFHSPTPIKLHSAKAEFLQQFDDLPSDAESSSRRSSRSSAISAPPSPTLEESMPFSPPPIPPRPYTAPPVSSSELVPLPTIYPPPSPREESMAEQQQPIAPSPLRISIPLPRTPTTATTPDSGPVTSTSRYFTAVSEEKFSPFSPFYIVGMDYFPETDEEEGYAASSSSDSTFTSAGSSVFIHDAISCAVTGFFVGAVITLYILSSQRRTLLTHLT
ncbi:hypothetical protein AAF712_001848 [Marasmius tenuissimus]|uniref:DUF7587 domain-containing protein n=1 Tax=Marasmius tenuissimus TaxID=585030 RepID=A0ABR3ABD8_9AGAR